MLVQTVIRRRCFGAMVSEESISQEPSLAGRRKAVERRIDQLSRRRAELAAGESPSPASVEAARRGAEEALQRAQRAHHAAAQRHREAAHIHERVANCYQMAAMEGLGDSDQLQGEADEHWQAANQCHRESVEDDIQADNPQQSSFG